MQNSADVNKTFSNPANYKTVFAGLAKRNMYAITSFIIGTDNDTLGEIENCRAARRNQKRLKTPKPALC